MKQRQRPKIQLETGYKRMLSKDSDDSADETELFIKRSYQDIPTMEKVVEEGDTLQALSIRYHCPISELKRLNNIHRENEIFAKRVVKVPARPFSMALASIHTSGSSSPSEKNGSLKKGVDAEILKSKLNDKFLNIPNTSSSSSNSNNSSNGAIEVNQVIFNSSVKPVSKVCDNVIENTLINEVDDEQVSLLPRSALIAETVVSRLSCSGADADIPWIALIICIVIVIFAVPLIYIFYIAEHFEQYHHSHS
ncbi:hypothetical protein ILUMI_05985 [Ignelater luminosus]|uniref:LysM domain-containing protein n=1 Tax=Ignelater luminosus TaxID=2038154 RepID=A0A8K0DGK1_IGNLU|nr:hypothetical protein ILUMI_05985 [Ignelater luminosus]